MAVHLDAVQAVGLRFPHHDLLLLAGQLVEPDDRVQPPVGDVHPVFVDHDREGVADEPGVDGFDVGSVEVRVLDVIEQGVTPVDAIGFEVDREAVGPAEGYVLEDHQAGAVGVGSADVGGAVPLGEVDVTFVWQKVIFV